MREITLTVFTSACARLPLVTEASGRVQSIYYDVGATIGGESRFARMDDTFLRLKLEEVNVEQTRLCLQIAFDKREVNRYEKLLRQNHAVVSQLDTFQQTLANHQNEQWRLEVESRVLNERLKRTKVLAPTGWRVTERDVEPEQWVNVGEHIGEVADFTILTVPFALTPEQHAALTNMSKQFDGIHLTLSELGQQVAASMWRTISGFAPTTRKIAIELKLRTAVASSCGGLRSWSTLVMLPPDSTQSEATQCSHVAARDSTPEFRRTLGRPS
jgi:multidrug efflux pump subunit AcrA (membrane-fusion protein)